MSKTKNKKMNKVNEKDMSIFTPSEVIEMLIDRKENVENERDLLLAVIVNKMPEKFVKIRTINDGDKKENIIISHKMFIVKPVLDEFGDTAFEIPSIMWFDFGCCEMEITNTEYLRLISANIDDRILTCKKLLEISKSEQKPGSGYTQIPFNNKSLIDKDDIIYTTGNDACEDDFEEDDIESQHSDTSVSDSDEENDQ